METTQQTQKTFLRKAAVEFNPLTIKEGETRFLQIDSNSVADMFIKSKGENVPCISVTDLESSKKHVLWLSGKLLTAVKTMQVQGNLTGRKIEVTRTGVESVDVNGDTWDMNNFEIHELQ